MRRREISLGLGREGPRPRVNETETETKKERTRPTGLWLGPSLLLPDRMDRRTEFQALRRRRQGTELQQPHLLFFIASARPFPPGARRFTWAALAWALPASLPAMRCGAARVGGGRKGKAPPDPTAGVRCEVPAAACVLGG
jgi:hypothetical protein